jgi:hypothetical protein
VESAINGMPKNYLAIPEIHEFLCLNASLNNFKLNCISPLLSNALGFDHLKSPINNLDL